MIELIGLAVIAFVQNMAFTAVSRSRNSGDPGYHRRCAYLSNGIWFVVNVLVWHQIWQALTTGDYWRILAAGVVYVIATSEGSVLMMRYLLRTERGKRRVGAR